MLRILHGEMSLQYNFQGVILTTKDFQRALFSTASYNWVKSRLVRGSASQKPKTRIIVNFILTALLRPNKIRRLM